MTAVRAAEDSLLLRKDDYAVCNFKEQLSEQRLKDKEKEDLVAKSDKQPAWVSLHMGVAEKRQGLCVFFFGCGVWQPLARGGISWPLHPQKAIADSEWFCLLTPRMQEASADRLIVGCFSPAV